MESRNTTLITGANAEKCRQGCSACADCHKKQEETRIFFASSRQLYAKEAEDYFFYFEFLPEDPAIASLHEY